MSVPSKKLYGIWAFIDICLLAAGLLSLILSFVWRAPNLVLNVVISDMDLNAGLALGIIFILTWVFSVVAVLQQNHVIRGLIYLNWILIADGIATLVVGSIVWYYSLQERMNYDVVWVAQTDDTREQLQDFFQCCGYWNATDNAVDAGFCATASNATACVDPLTSFADYTLNNIFTTIYGFESIVVLLFVATMCVISKRLERERFRRIDAKRGGRGFV